MSSRGTWLCTVSLLSSAQRRNTTWGPPRGVAGARGSRGDIQHCHQPKPSSLLWHQAGKSPPLSPTSLWWRDLFLCLPHYKRWSRGPVHAPFSVWFIIERYGEAKKSWLHRNNHSLEQICVIKQHGGINTTRCHCSDNNAVSFWKWIF